MAPPSSSPFRSPPLFSRSPLFTPIPEHDAETEDDHHHDHDRDKRTNNSPITAEPTATEPEPTPTRAAPLPRSPPTHVIDCSRCKPSSRDKTTTTSVVPILDSSPHTPGVLKSLLTSLTLTRRSPHPQPDPAGGDWKQTATDLSRKLLHATRKRDEALLEASRLKRSMADLEGKLTRLESYCHSLGASLDRPVGPAFPLEAFLRTVSEVRTMVRLLARSMAVEIRRAGPARTLDRIGVLLQSYDVRLPAGYRSNPKSLLFYLEALLNRVFYEDFESSTFERGGPERVLDPFERAASNRIAYEALRGLTWEEVLSKGTRHYSEGLSGFCDRKMSEVVTMLAWNRAWPEPLLQAFFGAAKTVWLVHLLSWSVHPAIPHFRVGAGTRFDPVYMEDMALDRPVQDGSTGSVQMMVAPGFYVYSSVIRCKVLCVYSEGCRGGVARDGSGGHVDSRGL